MIGFFSDPFPDELLYSACARYHYRVGYRSKEATARDLFGDGRAKIVIDFPTRLDYLTAQLPPATYTVNRLINGHTMLPFHLPFMPAERHQAFRRDMGGEGGASLHGRLGILTSGMAVRYLRFCVVCVEEDRGTFGEPYWHRVHQAAGVKVCPTHAVFLSNSDVHTRNRSSREAFITAKQATAELSSAGNQTLHLDPIRAEDRTFLNLARNAAWILSSQIQPHSRNALRRKYQRLLFERNLGTYAGTVTHTRLKKQFLDFYSSRLLDQLGCSLEGRHYWLRRFMNDWKHSRSPLHHLLVMQFLGCTAQEFFGMPMEIEPFGKGPWPCLNAAVMGHYRQPLINECRIGQAQKTRLLIGTFQCECGFSYRRTGQDKTEARRLEFDRIMTFGQAWYAKLREMLAAGGRRPAEIARALGVPLSTVIREITRVESFQDINTEGRLGRHCATRSALDDSHLRHKYRKLWRELADENPDAGRSKLGRRSAVPYQWLLNNDKKWLDDNFPVRRSRGPGVRVNWSNRDKEFSVAVRDTALKLLKAHGRPVRASSTRIAKDLGILAVYHKNPTKFPLVSRALEEVSESQSAFAIRRIRWAAECYRRERVLANSWKLLTRAALGNTIVLKPEVKAALDECAWQLRKIHEGGWDSMKAIQNG